MVGRSIVFSTLLIFSGCLQIATSGSYDERYIANIHTIQLFPGNPSVQNTLRPPVIRLGGQEFLTLEFDDLTDNYTDLYAKIIHCDRNWLPSNIAFQDYLNQYNEFPITSYEYSINSRIPYVHYRFRVPPLKLSGNYIIQVYKERDNILFQRRFVLYDPKAAITVENVTSNGVLERRRNQQINFDLNYPGLRMMNTASDISVVMRQNFRWDIVKALTPFIINEADFSMEFRGIDLENSFKAGNQFRFFDMRSVNYVGRNVKSIQLLDSAIVVDLFPEIDRGTRAFVQYPDQNGHSLIQSAEGQTGLFNEYCEVNFHFPREYQDRDLFVVGELTDWQKNGQSMMRYNQEAKAYELTLLLKQGIHYYLIETDDEKRNLVEGNHFETENEYDILVYYREPGQLYDQVIGYRSFRTGVI